MKVRFVLIALVSSLLFGTACHKSADAMNNNSQVPTTGSWKVSLFTDSGNDETVDFAGYSFSFNTDGSLTASKSGGTATGTWSSSNKFIINLGAKGDSNKPLGELTDDWHIISITSTEIKLGDDNAASGEALTFTKN